MKNLFIQRIYDAPIDIIGDIHGEIDALQNLIQILGYDRDGNHKENRKLILSVIYVIEGLIVLLL